MTVLSAAERAYFEAQARTEAAKITVPVLDKQALHLWEQLRAQVDAHREPVRYVREHQAFLRGLLYAISLETGTGYVGAEAKRLGIDLKITADYKPWRTKAEAVAHAQSELNRAAS